MDFTTIYKQYSGKIYRVCLGFLNDSEKAKDLTQETFIAVWQNLPSFRQESSVGTWIYRIATNKCLRNIEQDKKQVKPNFHDVLEEEVVKETSDEKLIFLRNCLAALPELDRLIITLFMEDVNQNKIAEITGLSPVNVRVKIHRIKDRLLKKFKENEKF